MEFTGESRMLTQAANLFLTMVRARRRPSLSVRTVTKTILASKPVSPLPRGAAFLVGIFVLIMSAHLLGGIKLPGTLARLLPTWTLVFLKSPSRARIRAHDCLSH